MAYPQFAHIGLNYVVQINRVIAMMPPNLKPGRTYLELAKNRGMHIDASRGRQWRSLLLLDDGTVITSATNIMTLLKRFREKPDKVPDDYMQDDAADLLESDDDEEDET